MSKRIVTWAVVVLAGVAALFGLRAWRGASAAKDAGGQQATVAAERRDLELLAEASGLVEAVRVVEVKSKASGEVLRVLHETGERVEQGTLLAEIDPRDVQSALEQAQADLSSARVKAQVTEAQRRRMDELRKSATVTQQEYDAAVDAAASAAATVVRGETALRLAKERRGDVTIRAPISGTVLERSVEPGQIIASATNNVSGGTTLFKMADLAQIQVRAKVAESDIGRVAAGQSVRVTVEAYPGRTFTGKVYKVEPQAVVEQNVTLFPVLVRLENKEGLLKPGMNAEVAIEIARRPNVVAVPSSAVVSMRDVGSAASALGLDAAAVQAAVRGGGKSAGGPADGGTAQAGLDPQCQALRDELREAGGPQGLSDEKRAQLRTCFQQWRAQNGGGGGQRGGARGPDAAATGTAHPGVVFVQSGTGVQARRVTLGLSDWEYTEVMDGLEPQEQVVLVTVAQLQQQQRETRERIQQRMGGGIVPGAGGGQRGGGGGSGGQRAGGGGGAGR